MNFNIKLCFLIILLVVSLTHSSRRRRRGRGRRVRGSCLNIQCSTNRDCCPYYRCKSRQCVPKNLKIYQQQYSRRHGKQHFNQENSCWLKLCNLEIRCCSEHPFCKAIPFMTNWGYCVEYNPCIMPPDEVIITEPPEPPKPPPPKIPCLEPKDPTEGTTEPPIEITGSTTESGPIITDPDTEPPTGSTPGIVTPNPSQLPPIDPPDVTQPPWCKSAGKMCNDHIECCEGFQCYKYYKLKKGLCLDPEQWEEYRRRYSKGGARRRRYY